LKQYGNPKMIVTDKLRSYKAVMKAVVKKPGAGSIIGPRIHINLSGVENER